MSQVQIITAICAGFIFISLIAFTFLFLWVLGREFENKAKSIMIKFPYLNKLFLFYLKWGSLTSIPIRIIFICIFYINLGLAIYYLSYLTIIL